jgi:hypothetical protein
MNHAMLGGMFFALVFFFCGLQAQPIILPSTGFLPGTELDSILLGKRLENHKKFHQMRKCEVRRDKNDHSRILLVDTSEQTTYFYRMPNEKDGFFKSILDSIEFSSARVQVGDSSAATLTVGRFFHDCQDCKRLENPAVYMCEKPGIKFFCDPATCAIAFIRVVP